ncbi:MAG TPA: glucokinase [Allosphingosinicella sp.]|nr:glucokinase [Allosphingosinicella sp.]
MAEIVAADIGGTHARFAFAEVAEGKVRLLGEPIVLKTEGHDGFASVWQELRVVLDRPLPASAGIAAAASMQGAVMTFGNLPWTIDPASAPAELGLDRLTLINDFEAVGHAVAQLDAKAFAHVCGPDRPLPERGVISVVGPGTGLGVAHLLRHGQGYEVTSTEGGHIGFAPVDEVEERILAFLRPRWGRVSIERIAAGMGLGHIYEALYGRSFDGDDKALWTAALTGTDAEAVAVLDRYLLCLGSILGDIALVHGSSALVIGGGLGQRLGARLADPSFHARFIAKGRFQRRMEDIGVKLITHEQPGLYGAAAAFASEHVQ